MKTLALLALLLAPTAALAAEPTPNASVAPSHHGAPFALKEAVTLDEVAKAPEKHAGKAIQVTGTVSAVCLKKGCWMNLKGETPTATARITFKDYGFFVPKDCSGKAAIVEGNLEVKKLSLEERKHFAEDGKVSVDQIPENELRLVATGVELK
jgi:hypothetical protein